MLNLWIDCESVVNCKFGLISGQIATSFLQGRRYIVMRLKEKNVNNKINFKLLTSIKTQMSSTSNDFQFNQIKIKDEENFVNLFKSGNN